MNQKQVATSKFLSLVLRHHPEAIGVTLDAEGWIDVDRLLAACSRHGKAISRGQLEEIVWTNDKRRCAFLADGLRIRADQGHSIEVDLGLVPVGPPQLPFHGADANCCTDAWLWQSPTNLGPR
ncbi:MAG: RNA 2'-phosphotransferase [Thermoguttaceae bacterium]|jgi:putative RNA 2'-phosphotransferase|nr:RNA 2'-phosphotransferase [Thermoguttaceae bacterium]